MAPHSTPGCLLWIEEVLSIMSMFVMGVYVNFAQEVGGDHKVACSAKQCGSPWHSCIKMVKIKCILSVVLDCMICYNHRWGLGDQQGEMEKIEPYEYIETVHRGLILWERVAVYRRFGHKYGDR